MKTIVTAAEVQAFLGDTQISRSEHLQQWIDGLTEYVRTYIDRPLETETFVEYIDGEGRPEILVGNTPLVDVISVSINDRDADMDYIIHSDDGEVYYRHGFPKGKKNVMVEYKAGHGNRVPDDLKLAFCIILEQVSQTSLLLQASRNEYSYIFAPTKWPADARVIIERYRRKL